MTSRIDNQQQAREIRSYNQRDIKISALISGYLRGIMKLFPDQKNEIFNQLPPLVNYECCKFYRILYLDNDFQDRYHKLDVQIEILTSANAKAESWSLVEHHVNIQVGDYFKAYGILLFLKQTLTQPKARELFRSVCPDTEPTKGEYRLSTTAFVLMLALVFTHYQVKAHQIETRSTEKPKIDAKLIQKRVEHLAIWIVRTFGKKQRTEKMITIWDNSGNVVEDKFCEYQFDITIEMFAEKLLKWVFHYTKAHKDEFV